MPTHRATATPAVVTSATTVTCPKPAGLADGDDWWIAVGWRGSVTVATPPSGFDPVPDASGASSTTASGVRAAVYKKHIDDAASEPASYDVVGSTNVFGTGFSWASSGGDGDDSVDAALLTTDTGADANVTSPAVQPDEANCLLYRLVFMNHPTAGFASGDFDAVGGATMDPANSPAMASGTNRVSGGLAYEAGPGTGGVSTGTEAWTVAGASWGNAVGITIAVAPPTIDAVGGDDQTVDPGELVTLDGSGTVGADTLVWSLISGTYPAAHLIPAGDGIVEFIAPEGPTELVFRLTATTGEAVGTDDVIITVTAGNGGLQVGTLGADGSIVY